MHDLALAEELRNLARQVETWYAVGEMVRRGELKEVDKLHAFEIMSWEDD